MNRLDVNFRNSLVRDPSISELWLCTNHFEIELFEDNYPGLEGRRIIGFAIADFSSIARRADIQMKGRVKLTEILEKIIQLSYFESMLFIPELFREELKANPDLEVNFSDSM